MRTVSLIVISIVFASLVVLECLTTSFNISNVILSITAVIIFWYTWETNEIRKISQEELLKSKRPIVGYELFNNPKKPSDTIFILHNHSDYPVAARVKCNFIIDEKDVLKVWPEYDGKEYWNLQYKQTKEGNFCWYDLYLRVLYTDDEFEAQKDEINDLKNGDASNIRKNLISDLFAIYEENEFPKMTMDLEIYSESRRGHSPYYLKTHYELDINRMVWIAKLTQKKPYWEYDTKPSWIK